MRHALRLVGVAAAVTVAVVAPSAAAFADPESGQAGDPESTKAGGAVGQESGQGCGTGTGGAGSVTVPDPESGQAGDPESGAATDPESQQASMLVAAQAHARARSASCRPVAVPEQHTVAATETALPFTGPAHTDALLVAGLLALSSGSALTRLGRR
jgi:hypothetical protein